MVKMFNIICLACVIVAVFNSGCGYLNRVDENFTIQRTPYTDTNIRIDGYYYKKGQDAAGVGYRSILFFYRNGVVLFGSTPTDSELTSWENNFKNGTYYASISGTKGVWGIFNIDSLEIIYEWWVNRNGSFRVVKYAGKIDNDTTIIFTSSEMADGSEHSLENMIYHFKQFSPKPDSVVSFIP